MAGPRLSMIVAMGRNRVIGQNGALPWRLSADLKNFKRVTMGHPVIMGRKTFQSIGRPLPGRHNIVVTRNPDFAASGVTLADSLEAALCAVAAEDEVFVIGGGEIYAQALGAAQRLFVTEVESAPPGDAYFPEIDLNAWHEISRQLVAPGSETRDTPGYSFVVFERRT